MDHHLTSVTEKRIQKTLKNLARNQMEGYFAKTGTEACEMALGFLSPGQKVAAGGSVTLAEIGLLEKLGGGDYVFLDRYAPGVDAGEMMRAAFSADTYFASTNALTEAGELYNVDGNGNRVAAMLYGPKQVVVIAGYNKIVADMTEAVTRVEKIAAPANVTRLNTGAPCAQTGECIHCESAGRICCQYVKMGMQRTPGRVKVIIVGEILGY